MAKCGCAGGACGCKVIAGRGAQVRGTGAVNNPYVIDAFPMSLSVQTSETVALTLTGIGTAALPWSIEADVLPGVLASKLNFWVGTQAEYDALGSYDGGTLYGITAT
jgi:hypothetical protein